MTDEYEVKHIPIPEIYNDIDFNCRGIILPIDVIDLARDIEINGLQFPIAIQPASEAGNIPAGFEYRIIAGHRRFVALQVLRCKTIPAMIKRGLSEVKARLINFSENLKREDLNLLQEAKAVQKLRFLGLIQEEIAKQLGISRGWVQVRLNLLTLPVDIQEEAAAGIINQTQVRQLLSLRTPERMYEAVKKIKRAHEKGIRGLDVEAKPQENPKSKKRQSKTVVQEMIVYLGSNIGYGLHTRVLAWANGEISMEDLYFDLKDYAKEHNIDFSIPS